MHKVLHPRDDVGTLYVSRKERGRGLARIDDSVEESIQQLENYIQKHDGGLIMAIRKDTDNTMDNRMTITKKQKWEGKQLYGRFKRLINNISHDKTWTWLRKGNFKRETESLLIAAQDNAVRTKTRIHKTQQNSKCRLCGDRDVNAANLHRRSIRQDTTGTARWSTGKCARNLNLTILRNIQENDTHKLLWGFNIQTDHRILARRQGLIIINNKKKENLQNCRLCCPGGPQNKSEGMWKKG